ncbi:MAG: hypothetical protein HFH60_01485 [Lachnospiraceae bacterium]|nr:hypothetical protein [Lachnospiraceae bacterium]
MTKLIGIIIGFLILWCLLKAMLPYLIVGCILGAVGYGIYRVTFKKETSPEQVFEDKITPEPIAEKEKSILALAKTLESYASSLECTNDSIHPLDKNNNDVSLSETNADVELSFPLNINPEIEELLWIADGKKKNYTPQTKQRSLTGNVVAVISDLEEPSALYLSLPIVQLSAKGLIKSPDYYPDYREFTPEQRWMYWEFLSNPFSPQNNVGYAFLFYYGLERHLIYGNLEKAFDTILKLREVYDNGSFQSYTAKALMLICIAEQRTDLALKFLKSYRNSDIASISLNYLLLLKYQFNDSLTAPEIIRNHKYFGFQNDRYIKKQPELFNKIFLELLQRNFHADQIDLNIHFPTDISALPTKQEKIFANISLRDYEAPMPFFQNSELIKKVLSLLEKCHETVKNQLRYGTNSNLGKIKGGKDRFDKDTFTSVDGHEFETYCAHLLSSDGFVSIELTKNSGD